VGHLYVERVKPTADTKALDGSATPRERIRTASQQTARANRPSISARGELSRGRLFRFFPALRSLEGIPVATRDRSNAASDVVVHFVGQIGEGHS
jgi:hypothetical protein